MSRNQSMSFYGPISRPICGSYRQIEQSVVYIILKIMLLRRLELLDWVELCTFRTYLNQCDIIHGKNDMPLHITRGGKGGEGRERTMNLLCH